MLARHWHDHGLKGAFFALALLAVAGCAGNGAAPSPDMGQPVATNDPIALFAASASPGSSGTVVLPETGQSVQVRLLRAYAAASGRECREVAIGPSQMQRVFCRAGNGWVPARPLLAGATGRS